MDVLIPILIIAVLILLNGMFVAAEFAIVAAPRTRMRTLAAEGSTTAKHVLAVLSDPARQNRYITTAQVGITIASLGLGMYGEHAIADWLLGPLESLGRMAEPAAHTLATILSVGLLTYIHVVIGEMIPKTLALQAAEPTALRLSSPMGVLEKIFSPAVWLLTHLAVWITRIMGIPPMSEGERLLTAAELEFIVEESSEGGLLEASEQLFIENILDLHERTADQVMTPRTRVAGIPANADLPTVMEIVCDTIKTRYPVYEGDLDNIIGLIHIKDLARYQVHPTEESLNIKELIRPVEYVPISLSLHKILVQFQRSNSQLAVVIDEYGGTAGILTLEDLVEEVVGEIQDEFDDHEILPIEQISAHVLRVRGDLILEELDQLYSMDIQHPEANTVGGVVMSELGRIPKPGDAVTYGGVTFEVEAVDKLAVERVLVHLPQSAEDGQHEA